MKSRRAGITLVAWLLAMVMCLGATFTMALAESPEPTVITWYNVEFRAEDTNPDNLVIHAIEKMTNTVLNLTLAPPEQAEEKLMILLGSGERPDIITFGTDETEMKLAEAGLLLPISEYFDRMPNLKASRTQQVWDAMTHADGKIYAIPSTTDAPATFVTIYRQDWLDKFDMDVPTNLDEYYAYCKKITTEDPDGDGDPTNTFAFSARGSISTYFDHIFSAFGCLPQHLQQVDGVWVAGETLPQAKEALKFLNMMYEEGMIDPEFTTDNSSRLTEKVRSGRFGAWHFGAYILDTNNIYNNYQPFTERNPDAKLVAGPPLKGYDDECFGYRQDISIRGWIKDGILADTQNLDACLRLIDFLASDAGVMLLNYGIEGEHYTITDGVLTDLVGDGDVYKQLGIAQLVACSKSTFYQTSTIFQDTLKMMADNSVPNLIGSTSIPEKSQYFGDLKDITATYYFRMITGELEIDGGFEEFVEVYNKSGGEALLEAINEAY